ncbi:hypothetical protein TcWFU_010060 [Taenia crassiceps]|uniref:Uncharacterized protein n=1 Tax=Taenia crassiceps TaxID=6207 RepID=A0ABR4QAC6_9CEST
MDGGTYITSALHTRGLDPPTRTLTFRNRRVLTLAPAFNAKPPHRIQRTPQASVIRLPHAAADFLLVAFTPFTAILRICSSIPSANANRLLPSILSYRPLPHRYRHFLTKWTTNYRFLRMPIALKRIPKRFLHLEWNELYECIHGRNWHEWTDECQARGVAAMTDG